MFECPHCKKVQSKKAGIRKNAGGLVQKYFCHACNTYFVRRQGFERMRVRQEIIIDALDLRAKGMSFGKISDHLFQRYNIRVSRAAILYWQKKFGALLAQFTKRFRLLACAFAHADEIYLRLKGQRGDEFLFYWDCIDYDTKFLVADHLSMEKNELEGLTFMQNLKEALLTPPQQIHTDNSYDYPVAIRRVFGWKKVQHIHFPAWKKRFRNNPIERFHNTLRENYKVMRRLCTQTTAQSYLGLFRVYYNFLRPHTTLGGQTPAQYAGFGQWTWLTLIRA